jgi:putative SOS response-associated peptidase YedK
MCGRYGLYSSQERLVEHFGLAAAPAVKARYNIAVPPEYSSRLILLRFSSNSG